MFKRIPGNNDYLISLNREIRDIRGRACALKANSNNEVLINMFGKNRNIDIEWLSYIAHFEVFLPDKISGKIFSINFENINTVLSRSVSGKTMVFKKPLSIIVNNEEFRIIPDFVRYAITKEGVILDLKENELVTISTNRVVFKIKETYPSAYIYDPSKSFYKYVLVHRLVASAWVKNNNRLIDVIVNHIDGDKTNYHYSNLEWCTYQYNSLHAVNTGLRTDSVKCKIRNFFTKEVIKFASVGQANAYMGLRKRVLRADGITDKKAMLISGKFEFKLDSDNTPWFYESREEIVPAGRYIITLTYPDGKIEYFYDTRDLKNKFKVWNIGKVKDIIDNIKQQYPEYVFEVEDTYGIKPLVALRIATGETFETKTIAEMSRRTNVTEDAIRACVRASVERSRDGFAFKYKDDTTPWGTEFVEYKKAQTRILATKKSNGEKLILSSMREAARYFNCDRTAIKNCIINEMPLKGWVLKDVTGEV